MKTNPEYEAFGGVLIWILALSVFVVLAGAIGDRITLLPQGVEVGRPDVRHDRNPRPFRGGQMVGLFQSGFGGCSSGLGRSACLPRLPSEENERKEGSYNQPPIRRVAFSPSDDPFQGCIPPSRFLSGGGLMGLAGCMFIWAVRRNNGWLAILSCVTFGAGSLLWLTHHAPCEEANHYEHRQLSQHNSVIVRQKLLTDSDLRYTVII